MSARAIVSGALYRAPQQKTSQSGRRYVVATIREGNGDGVRWWKAFIFSESACEALMVMQDGEPIAVAGALDAKVYVPNSGEPRVSLSLVADGILTARKPAKQSKEKSKPESSPAPRETGGDFNDDLPF